jgi:hypothetical protein
MKPPGLGLRSPIRIGAIAAIACWLAFACIARAENASPFLDVDAEACAKLYDKNLHVGPPDEDMLAACEALNRRTVLGQRFSGGPGALGLTPVGAALIYVVLGAPIRSVAALLGRPGKASTAIFSLEAALALLLRVAVGFVVLAILSLPFAVAGGCLLMLVAAVVSLRETRSALSEEEVDAPSSIVSLMLADAINDVYASAAGILGLALLARRDPWWLALGVALALPASVPAIIAARRRLRREPTIRLATTTVLAALFGGTAFVDPDLSSYSGSVDRGAGRRGGLRIGRLGRGLEDAGALAFAGRRVREAPRPSIQIAAQLSEAGAYTSGSRRPRNPGLAAELRQGG